MKSVLISIKPKYCELIANGKKTIEVRKTRPKIKTPFKCYIYCTSVKNLSLKEYVEIHSKTGGVVDNWNGKVIGEFVCDNIYTILYHSDLLFSKDFYLISYITYIRDIIKNSCLSLNEMIDYANGKEVIYAWHISDLKIYDEPKELNEFGLIRSFQSWGYVNETNK